MQIKKGYFYFIKDNYYKRVKDKELMQNKENGIKRPCLLILVRKGNKGLVFPDIINIKNVMLKELKN